MPNHSPTRTAVQVPERTASARAEGVLIIGSGRLGQAMGKLLARAGVTIRFVAARRPAAARRAVRFIGSGRPLRLSALSARELAQVRTVLVAVADTAIAELAAYLAHLHKESIRLGPGWPAKVVLHTCGSLPATGQDSVFAPLKRCGAAVGSLHPFQTVPSPKAGVRNLLGCFWGIEGEPAAARVARRWVRLLEGVAFRVRPEHKTLYHAAAFLVCPTMVTLMDRSEGLLGKVGVPPRIARPMLRQLVSETAGNFAGLGGRRALTGPAVRGDWTTIKRHRAALRSADPDVLPAYNTLLKAMLRLAGARPRAAKRGQKGKDAAESGPRNKRLNVSRLRRKRPLT
jgi:predicted short-subunit dehydrogenase-like oxidoreductase (DUF2520 family)